MSTATADGAPLGPVERIDAREAFRRSRDEAHLLVDVRTEAEFAAGHPEGAFNLPWQLALPGPRDPRFEALVAALFPPGTPLVLLCKSGVRSLRAAEALAAAGRHGVAELRPGYDGLRDAFGRVREPGWVGCALPVSRDPGDGAYAALLARVDRAAAGR